MAAAAWIFGRAGAGFLFLGLMVFAPPVLAAPRVDIGIEVLKASRSQKGFEGSARRYQKQLQSMGFVGARTIDTLAAAGKTEGDTVELRFKDSSTGRRARTIRVRVLDANPKRARFHIDVPAYNFSTRTTHSNGGTFLAVIPRDELVLAVHP